MSKPETRTNPVGHPVHDLIERRWSPVAFSDEPVSDSDLASIFEAARWAASCFNAQPWRFVLGRKGHGDDHAQLLSCLAEGNQVWAERAPVLVFVVARTHFEHNDKPNRWAWHDCGQALAHIMLEAVHRGMLSHAMAGFDDDRAREVMGVEEGYQVVAALALGHRGDGSGLPDDTRSRDQSPRRRKALTELIFDGRWGNPSHVAGS